MLPDTIRAVTFDVGRTLLHPTPSVGDVYAAVSHRNGLRLDPADAERRFLEAWRQGARFDGWSEHFSYERWQHAAAAALADEPVDLDWYTTREREEDEVLPWDHLDSGLDRRWLWDDWQDALAEQEVEDCRWTPCFDCGVCDQLGTEIQVGPSGQVLLPMPAPATARDSR